MNRPVLPHIIEAEESVIGAILVHARKLAEVVPLLAAEDFYHPALRAAYEAMLEIDAASKPVDLLTVLEQMRSADTLRTLQTARGEDFLTDLMAKVVTVENVAYHARIVRQKAIRRRWVEAFRELAAKGYGEDDDEEYFSAAEQRMLDLSTARQGSAGGPKALREVMGDYQTLLSERVRRRHETGSGVTGIPTGWPDLDGLLSGLHDGDLVIIAARPAMGKTAFATNLMVNAARIRVPGTTFRPHPGLLFSLEMSNDQLAERMVSGEARVDSQRLRQGDVMVQQWQPITRATGHLADTPIHIEDRGTITVAEIRSMARVWMMGLPPCPEHKVSGCRECTRPIIAVDYLQLVEAQDDRRRGSSRTEDVSAISRGLKLLAKDIGVPVIALSQLNRSLESRPDKRPMLSDLRDSGAIEQDADVVMFIYRDEVYHDGVGCGAMCERCAMKGTAEIIVAKQRMGPCKTVEMAFLKPFTKFESMSRREDA